MFMEKTGKIIIVFFVIVLFAALVLLSAVDLSKYIDRPEADTQGMVSSVGDQGLEKEFSETILSDKAREEIMVEDKGELSSSHEPLDMGKEHIQSESEVEEKADTTTLRPKDSDEETVSNAPEVFSGKKADAEISPKPDEKAAAQVAKKIVSKRDQKVMPEKGKDVEFYPYSVLLSTFKTLENAKKGIDIYKKKGFSTYWTKVDLGDRGEWYRVFTGFFKDFKDANLFIKTRHIAGAIAKKTQYTVLLGKFSSEKEIETEAKKIRNLGYSPYIINKNSERLLYIGAFFTEEGAIEQRSELIARGVQCHVAER
jgi:cell division septation protein DedD